MENKEKQDKIQKIKHKKGKFSVEEDTFLVDNYNSQSDEMIGKALNRTWRSIYNRRKILKLIKNRTGLGDINTVVKSHIAELTEDDKRKFFAKEIKTSPYFKMVEKTLTNVEREYYINEYCNFMTDPSIETMTMMEKNVLHDITMARIRMIRYMHEQQQIIDGRPVSRSKEIKECDDIISRAQESLNIERKQRLKNQSDQAITFTNLIKELKDPNARRVAGREAAMLKFIAEQFYNDHLGTNIISGKDTLYDIGANFKTGVSPSGISSDFTEL